MFYRLVQKYGTDTCFSLQIGMLKSLAFVPHGEVSEYYNHLYNTVDDTDMRNICSWFERNYIYGAKSQPKYSPKFWSVHDESTSIHFPRTQNNVEAWHRRLKVIVGKRNSGLYKLINDLKGELLYAKAQIARVQNGQNIKRNLKTLKANKKLEE